MTPPAVGTGTLRRLSELDTGGHPVLSVYLVHDQRHHRRAPGNCTQPSFPSPTQEDLAEHARRLAGLLLRAHRRRAFEELVVLAPSGLWPAIEAVLHSRLACLMDLELIDAPAQEIAHAVSEHAHAELAASSNSTRLPLTATISTARHAALLGPPESAPERVLTAAAR
jgi:hypothetical protein